MTTSEFTEPLKRLDTARAYHRDALEIVSVEVFPLTARFESLYPDGHVPEWLTRPAASHRTLPRHGQFSTLVRVRTKDGTEGVGECYGLPSPQVTATLITEVLTPIVLGRDAWAIDALWNDMFAAMSGGGHNRSFYLEAMSGLDIALWDLRGKAAGLPVHELLGGPHRDSVPVYASPIPMLPDPEHSANRAKEFVARGFRAMKLKLGRGPRVDLEHSRAVRAAVGDSIDVLVDLNCAYTSDMASRVATHLADLGITWLEEPVAVDDVRGYTHLRSKLPMTLVNGETLFTRYDFREFLVAGAVDVVMPNVTRAGGLTECVKIASLCQTFHVDIAPHGVGSAVGLAAALQLSAAIPNLRIYEFNQLPNPLRDDLLVDPFQLRDGHLDVPTSPGLGVKLDWSVIERYSSHGGLQ